MKTMKMYLVIFITVLITSPLTSISQSVSPAPGSNTVCPGEGVTYTVNPNPNHSGCGSFTWTLTNGSFNFGSAVRTKTTASNVYTVTVYWDDVASTGTLTVTSSCTSGGALTVGPLSYAIRSLNGRVPANARASQTLAYCNTNTITLAVDVMFMNNTGTTFPQERADGYEWSLPAGWKSNGVAGTISGATEFISVTPDNGCKGGSVTVRAYKNCGTKKYSSSASISLDRLAPSIQVTPPSGYSGSICGATQAVTFTVTPIPCATNYSWTFSGPNATTTSGWQAAPVSTSTNFLSVQPSGTPADAGSLKVTITLACESQLTSSPYTLTFKAPAISSVSSICYGGTNVSLLNVSPSVGVTWSTSSNMVISSGQGTSAITVKATTSTLRDDGTLTAIATNCPTAQRTVWVGRPLVGGTLVGGSSTVDNYLAYSPLVNKICNLNSFSTVMDIRGDNSILWERTAANPSNLTWRKSGDNISSYFFSVGQTETFKLTATNTCGTDVNTYNFKSITCSGSPCSQYTVSPNPSHKEVNIVAPNIPPPCNTLTRTSVQSEQTESQLTIKTVKLYNFDGQVVRSKEFNGDTKSANLNLTELPKGIYILKVSDGITDETHRIYIE